MALLLLGVGASGAEADNTISLPATLKTLIAARDHGELCTDDYFIRFPSVPGAVRYRASIHDTGHPGWGADGPYSARTETIVGPPFDDRRTDLGSWSPSFDAPRGHHQFFVPYSGSFTEQGTAGKAPCEQDVARHAGEISDPKAEAITTQPVIKGGASDGKGEPAVNVEVVAKSSGGQTYTTRTNDQGLFGMVVRQGRYRVSLKGLDDVAATLCRPGGSNSSVCNLNVRREGFALFRVIKPELLARVHGSKPICQADPITAEQTSRKVHAIGLLDVRNCDHPALLGYPIRISGKGFVPDKPVELKWVTRAETSQSSDPGKTLETDHVTPNGRGAFQLNLESDWLFGTCNTELEADQGSTNVNLNVPFRPNFVADFFGSGIDVGGHAFGGGYLCTDDHGTNWPHELDSHLKVGDGFVGQDINTPLTTFPTVDGASPTSADRLLIVSVGSTGSIDCYECTVAAAILEVERPSGKFSFYADAGRDDETNDLLWTFGPAPVTSPVGLISDCSAYSWQADQPVTWPGPEGTTSKCQQYPNSVWYQDGLSMGANTLVVANGQVRISKGGLTMDPSAFLEAANGILLVQGGLAGHDDDSLYANNLVQLAY